MALAGHPGRPRDDRRDGRRTAVIKAVPAAILGLGAGVAAYFGLALLDPALFSLHGNTLVVGALGGSGGGDGSFFAGLAGRWSSLAGVSLQQLQMLFIPALTLAVLLSIDTLKTCVVLDALTRSRHDSNRELIGQGLGNLASARSAAFPAPAPWARPWSISPAAPAAVFPA
jgi:SulP family sulfate permease